MKVSFFLFIAIMFGVTQQSLAFNGKDYFKNKCLSCHTIGAGDQKGPDLLPVFTAKTHGKKVKAKKHTNEWLIKFMSYPDGLINGDPDEPGYEKSDAHAKDLWAHFNKKFMGEVELSKGDFKVLIDYIEKTAKSVKAKKTKPLKS